MPDHHLLFACFADGSGGGIAHIGFGFDALAYFEPRDSQGHQAQARLRAEPDAVPEIDLSCPARLTFQAGYIDYCLTSMIKALVGGAESGSPLSAVTERVCCPGSTLAIHRKVLPWVVVSGPGRNHLN